MKTLLVTGGCGFIGSNFIRYFLQTHADWKIVNFDKLSYSGNEANLKDLESSDRYHFIQGDVTEQNVVFNAMGMAQAVVHFAAETHVDRSIENADEFLMTNIIGTRVMLEAGKHFKIKRFVHVSTDEVYGSIAEGSVDEEAPLMPNSPYSASKAAADLIARAYLQTYGYAVMIVRACNNYGPYQFPEKVIPLFVTNLMGGAKVPLYGDGQNSRDWIYVEDNCRAIDLVLEKGNPGEIYNIGAGQEMTNLNLTKKIIDAMNMGIDQIKQVEDRPGHDRRYSINCDKLKGLGFKPQISFEEGLKRTVDWYQSHKSWWQPFKGDKYTVK